MSLSTSCTAGNMAQSRGLRSQGPSRTAQRLPPPPRRRQQAPPPRAISADGDAEVAVFRFTLGNDTLDALVPRVAGVAGATLLLLNHLLQGETASDAQVRAEALGAALAAVACVTPTIEQRLKELQPGGGRQAAAAHVEGAVSVFALQPGMPEALQQELAWASYTLLLNTNICGLAVFWRGQAVLARGLLGVQSLAVPSLGAAAGGVFGNSTAAAVLAALSSTELAAASGTWQQGVMYCPDRVAMGSTGAANWGCVPEGIASVLVQPLLPLGDAAAAAGGQESQGVLLLLSERPFALSAKERSWAAATAAKLQASLATLGEA